MRSVTISVGRASVPWLTGSGQGIGQAAAQLLASKGVRVAVNDIVPERAEATVGLITQAGGEAFAAPGDISNPSTVERVFQQLDERLRIAVRHAAEAVIFSESLGR